jgi:hypothetical protein
MAASEGVLGGPLFSPSFFHDRRDWAELVNRIAAEAILNSETMTPLGAQPRLCSTKSFNWP